MPPIKQILFLKLNALHIYWFFTQIFELYKHLRSASKETLEKNVLQFLLNLLRPSTSNYNSFLTRNILTHTSSFYPFVHRSVTSNHSLLNHLTPMPVPPAHLHTFASLQPAFQYYQQLFSQPPLPPNPLLPTPTTYPYQPCPNQVQQLTLLLFYLLLSQIPKKNILIVWITHILLSKFSFTSVHE